MKKKQFDVAVVIGRFQPFHVGHVKLVEHAYTLAERVIVVVGSAAIARNPKNPFTYEERVRLIHSMFPKVECVPVTDYHYNDMMWVDSVESSVSELANTKDICLVGHEKDTSSFYLRMFPRWKFIPTQGVTHEGKIINSTDIREVLYEDYLHGVAQKPRGVLPGKSEYVRAMLDLCSTDEFQTMADEHNYIREYQKPYRDLPFPPIFVTVDAVVVCNAHVLMIRRRTFPGKGLMALPGGFLNQDERIESAIVRELQEETRIKVPTAKLRDSLKFVKVFDAPGRSLRGRSITHCGLIVLHGMPELPQVRGSDDADRASWIPIHQFYEMSDMTFEDHYSIVTHMIGSQ